MNPTTVGHLIDQLTELDRDLPVGVCQLTVTTDTVTVELDAADAAIITRDGDHPTAVWLTTSSLQHHQTLQQNRPQTWVHTKPCGCLTQIDISTPGQSPQARCQHDNPTDITPAR